MDQNLLAQLRDYELRTFIDQFRQYLVSQTVNPYILATSMGAPGETLSIVLAPLDNLGKNERVYDYVRGKNNWSTFLQALKESGNSHIEAFVIQEISRRASGKSSGPFMGTGVSQHSTMNTNPNVGFVSSPHQFPNQPIGPTNMGWNQQNHVSGISSNVNPSSTWPTQVQQPAICPYPVQAQRTVGSTSTYPPSQQQHTANMMPSPYPPYNNNLNTNVWNQVPGSTVNISPYPTHNFAPTISTPTSQPTMYPPSPLPPYQQSTIGTRPSAPSMNNPGSHPGPFPPYYSM